MRIHVLGCAGAELPNINMPAFLVDEEILLDGGTISVGLSLEEQERIRCIFLTHAHLDHTKAIPFFADNIVTVDRDQQIVLFSTPQVISILRENMFNDLVWPDFTRIPSPDGPVLSYRTIEPWSPIETECGHRITAITATHPTPAVGFLVEDKAGARLLYTGDTGPTFELWKACDKPLDALIVEVSFPNRMEERALVSGHLTPHLLTAEMGKMKTLPRRILITHAKPAHREAIFRELGDLGLANLEILVDDQVIEL